MKSTPFILKKLTILTWVIGAGTLSIGATPLTLGFDEGNSTSAVDAYRGTGGDGWNDRWFIGANGGTLTSGGTVIDTDPFFTGSGNYMNVFINNQDTGNKGVRVGREFSSDPGAMGISRSAPQTVSFDYRFESDLADASAIYFMDNLTAGLAPGSTGAEMTWGVSVNTTTGNIGIYNGTSAKATGVILESGAVYRFVVDIVPLDQKYFIEIFKLDLDEEWQSLYSTYEDPTYSNGYSFYTDKNEVSGYLTFSAYARAGKEISFSVDNISVIPEPATVVLLGGFLVALLFLRRARNSNL